MRILPKAVLAGAALVAIAGAAIAADKKDHVMTVAMPDGTVRHIAYPDDVAPRIIFVPARAASMAAPVTAPTAVLAMSPFAMFDRIAAQMDAQADAMLRQAAMLSAAPAPAGAIHAVAGAPLPRGAVSYSFFSSTSSDGRASCSRSVQITSFDPKRPPRIASQSSGDCSAMGQMIVHPAATPAVVPKPAVTPARYDVPGVRPEAKADPAI